MTAPSWLSAAFAGLMLLIAGYAAARLIAAAAWRRDSELDADGLHLLMGTAMAGMLVRPVSIGPPEVWEVVFAVASAWFAGQAFRLRRGRGAGRWRCPYPVPHLAESLAMVYMLAATRAPAAADTGAGMPGMGGTTAAVRFPVLAIVLALVMVGYVAWLGDRVIAVVRPAAAAAAGPALAPRAAACAKIVMGVTMAYMLIIMV